MLRKSNNPYACHYYDPQETRDPGSAREQYRASENPYALHYFHGEKDDPPAQSLPNPSVDPIAAVAVKTISKANFEAGCRSVFRRYMPEMERAKLRPHHQDFIRRNSLCSPERRYALLQELRRYDLSDEPGLQTYFNYEEDVFTETKLKAIEDAVKET